jgi:hypothetical protein
MSFPSVYNPAIANPADQENITLAKILDATSGVAYDYELSNFVAADKPGTIVIKNGSQVLKTLTLSYDGSNNLTSIVRS